MSLYGTKCSNGPHHWSPWVLGDLYKAIVAENGAHALNKPKPGDKYRKMYKPLTDIDRPYFRKLPASIIITSPPRLFRSSGHKYKGRVYLDCEYYWSFDYKHPWGDGFKFDSMPIRILSYCYIYSTVTSEPFKAMQLSLFD